MVSQFNEKSSGKNHPVSSTVALFLNCAPHKVGHANLDGLD